MLKGSEAALRRLAVILKDSNDAITVLDLHGNYLAWNKGAEKIYGYTEEEALKMLNGRVFFFGFLKNKTENRKIGFASLI